MGIIRSNELYIIEDDPDAYRKDQLFKIASDIIRRTYILFIKILPKHINEYKEYKLEDTEICDELDDLPTDFECLNIFIIDGDFKYTYIAQFEKMTFNIDIYYQHTIDAHVNIRLEDDGRFAEYSCDITNIVLM